MGTDSAEASLNQPDTAVHQTRLVDVLHGTDPHLVLSILRGQPATDSSGHTPQALADVRAQVPGAPLNLTPSDLPTVGQAQPAQGPFITPLPVPRPHETAPSPACKTSPAYEAYISFAERHIYDVKSLGDPDTLMHRFDCDVHNTRDAMDRADEALAVTKDRYNWVETPEQSRRENEAISGSSSQIGIRVQSTILKPEDKSNKQPAQYASIVDNVLADTPAAKAGLRPGDQIMRINGKTTLGMDSRVIEDLLTGDTNTPVTLTLRRGEHQFDKTMRRQDIDMPTVEDARDLGNGVAYIQMHNFGDTTVDDLARSLDEAKDAKAIVIDLRNNGGGLLDTAIQAAELLTQKGVILNTDERLDSDVHNPLYETVQYSTDENSRIITKTVTGQTPQITREARSPYMGNGRPIIVLTNEGTASAAEIFAGALRDTSGATLVGEQTYGKGIGQTIQRGLPGGAAVKVTSFRYTTPSGEWPGNADSERHGLTPKPENLIANQAQAFLGYTHDQQLIRARDLATELITKK